MAQWLLNGLGKGMKFMVVVTRNYGAQLTEKDIGVDLVNFSC
jgi:hypothetical protein